MLLCRVYRYHRALNGGEASRFQESSKVTDSFTFRVELSSCEGKLNSHTCWSFIKHTAQSMAGADGSFEEPLETTWSSSDLTARPCLASAASELHFSPGSPEETPLHKMLFLPAAALCCLCSALAAMATQLIQERLTHVAKVGTTISLKCSETGVCEKKHVYWYQNTKKYPLRVILRIDLTDGHINKRYNHPQRDDFSASKEVYGCDLVIKEVKVEHEGSYFCVCWKRVPQ
ncbi:hypothetical protein GOODEAATRI_020796 [Goodea atripinnis]|uniref:Ig-like domain-containing protein n=1 Tax=Goodea atripinnis TaxID=208336 RepID=A0ABV0N320_9TELE